MLPGASQAAAEGFGGREEVCICCFHQGTAQTEGLERQSSRLFLGCGYLSDCSLVRQAPGDSRDI